MSNKIKGKMIAEFNGLRIYARVKKPKKKGKERIYLSRIYLSIRQEKPKVWRVAATLSYAYSLDARFEKQTG